MRRRKVVQTVVQKIEKVERLERKQSTHSRTQELLSELGIDRKEWQLESKLMTLNRMAKMGLI
jgi:hypothetical protein